MKVHHLSSTHTEGTRHRAVGDGTVAVMDPGDTIDIPCEGLGCRFCEMEAGEVPLDLELDTTEEAELTTDLSKKVSKDMKGASGPVAKSLQSNNLPDGESLDDIEQLLNEG